MPIHEPGIEQFAALGLSVPIPPFVPGFNRVCNKSAARKSTWILQGEHTPRTMSKAVKMVADFTDCPAFQSCWQHEISYRKSLSSAQTRNVPRALYIEFAMGVNRVCEKQVHECVNEVPRQRRSTRKGLAKIEHSDHCKMTHEVYIRTEIQRQMKQWQIHTKTKANMHLERSNLSLR